METLIEILYLIFVSPFAEMVAYPDFKYLMGLLSTLYGLIALVSY